MSDSHLSTDIAMPYDNADQQRMAAKLGMWIFLATEVLFFGGMFVGYTAYRYEYFEAFDAASRELNLWIGGLMTGVLLLGSLLVALSDHAMEEDDVEDPETVRKGIVRRLIVTAILGALFLGMEFYEYSELIGEGLFPGSGFEFTHFSEALPHPHAVEMFFVVFFCMTGLHACHMIIGISLVSWLAWMMHRAEYPHQLGNTLTVIGLYWHFVDIVWIFLYPLFYLVR